MATVKLNAGGKVLTKAGKVSCGCCGVIPPAGCCMYPSPELGLGLYSIDDLPDTIVLKDFGIYGDFILYRGVWSLNPAFMGPIGSAGAYWGRSEPEFDEIIIYYQENYSEIEGWAAGPGVEEIGICLFSDNFDLVKDPFADTYNWLSDDPFTGDPYNPVSTTVTRVSLCRWEGPLLPFVEGTIFCKPVLYLYKGLNDVPNEYGFVWRMQWEGDAAETGGDKIGFNNTPVGEYDADPTPGTWVIS